MLYHLLLTHNPSKTIHFIITQIYIYRQEQYIMQNRNLIFYICIFLLFNREGRNYFKKLYFDNSQTKKETQ